MSSWSYYLQFIELNWYRYKMCNVLLQSHGIKLVDQKMCNVLLELRARYPRKFRPFSTIVLCHNFLWKRIMSVRVYIFGKEINGLGFYLKSCIFEKILKHHRYKMCNVLLQFMELNWQIKDVHCLVTNHGIKLVQIKDMYCLITIHRIKLVQIKDM